MKNTFFLITIMVINSTFGYSQKIQLTPEEQKKVEQIADSSFASLTVDKMGKYLNLTDQQRKMLYQAGITTITTRREVFKQHWKKASFRAEMAKVSKASDSLYQSIIGQSNLQKFKDSLRAQAQPPKEMTIQQRARLQQPDTLTYKKSRP